MRYHGLAAYYITDPGYPDSTYTATGSPQIPATPAAYGGQSPTGQAAPLPGQSPADYVSYARQVAFLSTLPGYDYGRGSNARAKKFYEAGDLAGLGGHTMHPTARGLYAVETYDMHPYSYGASASEGLGAFDLNSIWGAAKRGFDKYKAENPAEIKAYGKYLPQISVPIPKVVKAVGSPVFSSVWRDAVQMITDKKKAASQAAAVGQSSPPEENYPRQGGPNWLMLGGGMLAVVLAAKVLRSR